jgi:hypothetical protein
MKSKIPALSVLGLHFVALALICWGAGWIYGPAAPLAVGGLLWVLLLINEIRK